MIFLIGGGELKKYIYKYTVKTTEALGIMNYLAYIPLKWVLKPKASFFVRVL